MTSDEVRDLLRRIGATFGSVSLAEANVAVWAETLARLTPVEADAAFAHHARTNVHTPRPADLWASHRALTAPQPAAVGARIPAPSDGCEHCDHGVVWGTQPHPDAHLGRAPIEIVTPCPRCRP